MDKRGPLSRLFAAPLAIALATLSLSAFASDQEASSPVGPPPADATTIVADALQADPNNSQLHLEYGQALWRQGQPLLDSGQSVAAGEFIRKAELHLQRVIELTATGPPEAAPQRGQSFYLLSEISAALKDAPSEVEWLLLQATTADPGNKKAQQAYTPFDRGDRPQVRTARASVQMTSIGSRGIPKSKSKPKPADEAAAEKAPEPSVNIAETNAAGMPKAILYNGVAMNLVHEAQDVVGPLWAYVPELQDIDNWKEMEVVRRHLQYQDPMLLAEKTSEYAFQRGGVVIDMTSTKGLGRLIFVTHADATQQSEVNVLFAYAEDDVLFAKHYARRFGGPTHREDSIRAAKANGKTWLEHLAIQNVNIPH
jgi:hypothetical protein